MEQVTGLAMSSCSTVRLDLPRSCRLETALFVDYS